MQSRKIVLIGKTGDGKSSAGNTILSNEVFTTEASATSVTAKSERRDGSVHGRKITVIDTPGFFDTDRKDEEIKSEIIKSLVDCAPAVHAFVIVLKVGRYTSQENEVVQQFLNTMNGEHVLKHTVILFTFGEQLEGKTIEEFVKANPQLQELVDKCGGRCHVIDNKYWNKRKRGNKSNRVQVKNLLETIDKMEKENGCFSNELLKKLEEDIQEEIKKIEENLPPEEKREKAKEIVHKNIGLQIIGTLAGTLIGALLGVVVAVATVMSLLMAFKPACKLLKTVVEAATAVKGVAAGVEGVAAGVEAVAVAAGVEAVAVAAGVAAVAVAAGVEAVAVAAGVEAVAVAAGVEAVAVAAGVEAVAAGAAAGGAGAAAGGAGAAAGSAAGGAGAAAGAMVGVKAVGVAALAGAICGGVTGWKAAEEADSVYDAASKAAKLNCENAKVVFEKIRELVDLAFNDKLGKE